MITKDTIMSDDKMWNGGKTNESKDKAIREWNKMIRKSEDYLDGVDVETQDIKEASTPIWINLVRYQAVVK